MRIGEALQPGPPRRITGSLRLPSQQDIAMPSMSSSTDDLTQRLHTPLTEPATTDTSQPLSLYDAPAMLIADANGRGPGPPLVNESAERAPVTPRASHGDDDLHTPRRPPGSSNMSPGMASTPGASVDQAPPIRLKLASGDEITVCCRWIRGCRSWRWQGGARSRKMTKDSRQGPRHALQQWIAQCAAQLSEEAMVEAQQALALLPSDTDITPPTASTPRRHGPSQQQTVTPPSQHTQSLGTSVQLPSVEEAQCIANLSSQEVLSQHVTTQRTLPSSVRTQIMNTLRAMAHWGRSHTGSPLSAGCQNPLGYSATMGMARTET